MKATRIVLTMFQLTAPLREPTKGKRRHLWTSCVSTHGSLAGADESAENAIKELRVSTHGSLAGADTIALAPKCS